MTKYLHEYLRDLFLFFRPLNSIWSGYQDTTIMPAYAETLPDAKPADPQVISALPNTARKVSSDITGVVQNACHLTSN